MSKSVLIVEDENLIRGLCADVFTDAGYSVTEVGTGDEALALLNSGAPIDLVFTGVKMPGSVDGLALRREVEVNWPHTKMLITSGHMTVERAKLTAAPTSSPAAAPPPAVDVGAVLSAMAGMKEGGGNYQSSIVDLLQLLDLDSSLSARKELAEELNVHVGADGTAEQNVALHRAVIAKLAENGGIVPDDFRS